VKMYEIPPQTRFERTQFTLDEFVVNGVNLADYGFEHELHKKLDHSLPYAQPRATIVMDKPYKLYSSFNIGDMIEGTEDWFKLFEYHGVYLKTRDLIFYNDKIAFKRFMEAVHIPHTKNHALKYWHELIPMQYQMQDSSSQLTKKSDRKGEVTEAIKSMLPRNTNFVAKPSHSSSSTGVWMVQYNETSGKSALGYERVEEFDETALNENQLQDIATKLNDILYDKAHTDSWSLLNVKPGIMVEDRFTAFDSDSKPALEFKTYTIWGRVFLAYWKRGSERPGLVWRNGTVMKQFKEYHEEYSELPDWFDWSRVVEVAERMGRNKDLMRIDIFVGVPAGSIDHELTLEEKRQKIQYVVNEIDHRPKNYFQSDIHNEGKRLWIAGYKMGLPTVVPNDEIPEAFMQKGYLSAEDAKAMEMKPGEWWNKQD